MQGYSLIVQEALEQAPSFPTHVFVQGGIGGWPPGLFLLVGEIRGVPATLRCCRARQGGLSLPQRRRRETYACGGQALYDHGRSRVRRGSSTLAWRILDVGADAFITVGDEAAADCMRAPCGRRALWRSAGGGRRSRGRRVAALLLAAASSGRRRSWSELLADSRVLVFGTEGATDPEVYRVSSVALRRTSPA